jgi:CHAT domain-containing protein/tetratricopeptide (TPR) repeat protein
MTESRGDGPVDPTVLLGLVAEFSSLPAAEARELAETQPALLTDDADRVSRIAISFLLDEENREEGSSAAALRLERCRLLLLRCRRLGVRQAFSQLPELSEAGSEDLLRAVDRASVLVERSPTAAALDGYIAALLDLALLTPSGHPVRSVALNNLAGAFFQRDRLTGDPSDIRAAVAVWRDVLEETPLTDPRRPNRLTGLGKSLVTLMNQTGDRKTGLAALAAYEEALELTGPDDPARSATLGAVAGVLLAVYPPDGSLPTLARAIELTEQALALPFVLDDDRLLCTQQLARALLLRFAEGRDPADRDRALAVFDAAFAGLDTSGGQRRFHSGYFGNELLAVYSRTAEPLLLDRAIELLGVSVDRAGFGTGDTGRAHDLGVALLNRYERAGAADDLRRAVDTLRRTVQVLPAGLPRPSASHMALADALLAAYRENGAPEQLDEAVALLEPPVTGAPPEPYHLAVLGRLLTARYLHRRGAADLDNAIRCLEEAVAQTPSGLSGRSHRLQALGRALQLRFQRSRGQSDIRRAVAVLEESVTDGSADPVALPPALSVLGVALLNLHADGDEPDELARAAELTRRAAEQTPVGSPALADHLWNYLLVSRAGAAASSPQPSLADVHRDLLDRCRVLRDVRAAIAELGTFSAPGEPAGQDSPPRPGAARLLLPPPLLAPVQRASAAWNQYGESGTDDSLTACVDAWRNVLSHGLLDTVPARERGMLLNAAAQAFAARFERTGSLSDADAAIEAYERLAAVPEDGDKLRGALIAVSACLLKRHDRSKDTTDVNRALDRLAAAARRPPHDDEIWTDAARRFIGVLSVHAEALSRTTGRQRWLEVADELLGLAAPGELAEPGWQGHLLLVALLNATARRWAAAQRWADAAWACATAAGDGSKAARAAQLAQEMRQRLAEEAGAAEETVSVDLDGLMDSVGDRSDPAAARKRLSLLRAMIAQTSPTGNLGLWGLLTAALMQELVMGLSDDHVASIEEALDLGRDLLTALREGAADPSLIASVCNDLANLYMRRARGPKSGNLERAVELATERIALLEPGTTGWASAQAQLGFVLTQRSGLERAASVERAVACCEAALEVLDPRSDPDEWAYARNALGCAYGARSAGSRAENIERARQVFEQTLEVLGTVPPAEANAKRTWGNLHYNLGNIYQNRSLGGSEDNMRRAIHHRERELTVTFRDQDPISWATTQVSLAHAYSRLGGDDPAETQRKAIVAVQEALKVFSVDRTPEQWADAQDLLGLVLCDGYQVGRRRVDPDKAAECFAAALQVYGRESHPYEWAGVQMNRTMVSRQRAARCPEGSAPRQVHLREAAARCQQALEVYALDTRPAYYADAQASLGDILAELAEGDSELQDAARALEAALEIYQVNGLSPNIRMLCIVLAEVYGRLAAGVSGESQDQGQSWWRRAAQVCEAGIAAAETLYESSLLRQSRNTELRMTSSLVSTGAAALVRLGLHEQALVLVERGRARWLSEALARDRADLRQLGSRHHDLIENYRDAAQQVEAVERFERQANRPAPRDLGEAEAADPEADLLQQAARARERMGRALERIRLIPGYAQFLQLPDMSDIGRVVGRREALVTLVPSIDGCLILVAYRDQAGELTVNADRVPELTVSAVDRLLLRADADGPSYVDELYGGGEFTVALDTLLSYLGGALAGRVARRLRDAGATSVLLVLAGRLGLTALHAAPYETDGRRRCLVDEFDVRYAPSAAVTATSDPQASRQDASRTPSLVGIANPNGDLPYAEAELDAIAAMFPAGDRNTGTGTTATKERLLEALEAGPRQPGGALYVHLACHGLYDPVRPLDSCLRLAGQERLTLGELLDKQVFRHARLIVASACQTAITDFADLPDESLGLLSGCLHAGAPAAIGTLWSVNDLSTALLMTRFHQYLHNGDVDGPLPLARALRMAQCWLRDVTAGEIEAFFGSHEALGQLPAAGSIRSGSQDASYRPFSHPYYWAPFVLAGG